MSTKDTTRLAAVAQEGQNADVRLRQMAPVFEKLQADYYRALVTNTAADGQVHDATVWKMVALNDVIKDLKTASSRGREASAKLENQRLAGTGGSNA